MPELNNILPRMSVPLRQCLVTSVMYGDSHQLPAALFSKDSVSKVVEGVTGECPDEILSSLDADILLVFAPDADINRVKVQLECQSSWMEKPVHLKCRRPSGIDIRQFGVLGSVGPSVNMKDYHQKREGDSALALPFFSGKTTPQYDEVTFDQWLSAVQGAQQTSYSSAVHCWIHRSVREPAVKVIRNLDVGAPINKILSSLKLACGVVSSFDELMKEFLNVFQFPTESVYDYVVRLDKAFTLLRDNYPKESEMVEKTQHLRERFYQGLRQEIHQRLTPSYEDRRIPYEALIKKARQLEEEYCPPDELVA